jgi:hypothetical protein
MSKISNEIRQRAQGCRQRIAETDVLILGLPIYFGSVTGEMQSFLERLQFPFLPYADLPVSLFPGKIRARFTYRVGECRVISAPIDAILFPLRKTKLSSAKFMETWPCLGSAEYCFFVR